MAGIKIAKFNTVVEKNAVALPVEAVGKKNFALGTSGDVSQIGGGDDFVLDRAPCFLTDFASFCMRLFFAAFAIIASLLNCF